MVEAAGGLSARGDVVDDARIGWSGVEGRSDLGSDGVAPLLFIMAMKQDDEEGKSPVMSRGQDLTRSWLCCCNCESE